jgi:hypothetical protein
LKARGTQNTKYKMTGPGNESSSAQVENKEKILIGDYAESYLLERAKEIVAERTKDWELNLGAVERLPKFHADGKFKWRGNNS